jgi:hypothetical protein
LLGVGSYNLLKLAHMICPESPDMNKLNWQRVKDLLAQGRVQISPKEMISIRLGQIQAEYLWFPPPELHPNISEDKNNLQSQNYGRLHQFK